MLAKDVTPVVPAQGSVGASGDLAPLAHMTAVIIGDFSAGNDAVILKGAFLEWILRDKDLDRTLAAWQFETTARRDEEEAILRGRN